MMRESRQRASSQDAEQSCDRKDEQESLQLQKSKRACVLLDTKILKHAMAGQMHHHWLCYLGFEGALGARSLGNTDMAHITQAV